MLLTELLEYAGEAGSLPAPQGLWQTAWEEPEERLHADLIVPPPGQCSTLRRGLPEPTFPPVGREDAGWTTSPFSLPAAHIVDHFVVATTLISHTRESAGPGHWESWGDREGVGIHRDLGRLNAYLQCPSYIPNWWLCSSAEPKWECTLIRELGRGRSVWHGSSSEFCQP